MNDTNHITADPQNLLAFAELREAVTLARQLAGECADITEKDDALSLRKLLIRGASQGVFPRDRFGISTLVRALDTAVAFCQRVSPDRNVVAALLVFRLCEANAMTANEVAARFGDDVAKMVGGLIKVSSLYQRGRTPESENFRRLLMAFAEDIRVIIMMIVDRLVLMKRINHHPSERMVRDIAVESNYLYASLAHRLGLYSIKSELEDMSLKYTDRDTYTSIARGLNERKAQRDAYIASFIAPVKQRLQEQGLKFDIKGRTKSIFSIWNKIRKQHNDLDHIYDLFAIRIIIDTPPTREKTDCWMAYSVITDMYQPNPSRMKDWISVPKSNGYESLHITVAGPEGKWVEVQIRTRRMDLVAEKGLAAHWRYKGIRSEANLDSWMNNVRDILEAGQSGPMELMRNFKMDIYDKEVFCFTPRGDLFRLPAGATLLDFAFHIHTRIGSQCVGGRVNGKNEKLTYRLRSGDTVDIQTSQSQSPKPDWLNIAVTSKARTKIRQTLKERENKEADLGREMLMRRLKNRKIDFDEAAVSRLVKKLGYQTMTDFFNRIAQGQLNIVDIIDQLSQSISAANPLPHGTVNPPQRVSAEEFSLQQAQGDTDDPAGQGADSDVLVIGGGDIKGINYRMARCCNPVYGDDVFGFISAEGVIKIHRTDCPNAANIRQRYPYRMITTRWSGKAGGQMAVTLRVVGTDDIGIVTNITSIIYKEKGASLRAIAIDSNDGLFQGHLTVGITDNDTLTSLLRKIATVKGVRTVTRAR